MERIPMTANGLALLQDELKTLKSIERPAIIKALEEARSHGDLSENAEYEAARERQSFTEGRVADIEDKLRRAEVIDVSKLSGNEVKFGATVVLEDEDTGEKSTYQIVGVDEADIGIGLLSVNAPLGRALINKTVGDNVEVTTPRGTKAYEITRVRFK
jgi:transcription elongation factor GreA